MADRVCVMSRGRAEQIATPAELYSKPSTEFVAQFVGSRAASRSSATVTRWDCSDAK